MLRKSAILLIVLLLVGGVLPAVYAQQTTEQPNQPLPFYLLTVRGTLAPATVADAQSLHNQTAGAPDSIKAAASLGDLTHMIYLPMQPTTSGAGEVLFIDQWNSIDGLNQFFANPQVQQQAGQLFSQRDATVWIPAEGFYTYHLAAPYGVNDRYVVLLRGTVQSRDAAMALHNQIVGNNMGAAHAAGDLSHDVYFMATQSGAPASNEFLAIDQWDNADGMNQYYKNPAFASVVQQLFTGAPDISIWNQTTGDWKEW